MYRNILDLKSELDKLLDKGNINLLSVCSFNSKDEMFLPYNLYFEQNNNFFSIMVAVDLLEIHKFNSINEILIDINNYYQCKGFIKKDIKNNLNKISPFMKLIQSIPSFDISNAIWNDDFIIAKRMNKDEYAVFLSEDFKEATPSEFLNYMCDNINNHTEEKVNDFSRLSLLGYNISQINQIIKSKSILDIEPFVNNKTSVDSMIIYNKILNEIPINEHKYFKQCLFLRSNLDFFTDKRFTPDQKKVIFYFLDQNIPYNPIITPEYSPTKMELAYEILTKNPSAKINPNFSLYRLSVMSNNIYNMIAPFIKDDIKDERLFYYITNLKTLYFHENKDNNIELFKNYISEDYSIEHINVITDAIKNGLNKNYIDIFSNPEFSYDQMIELKKFTEKIYNKYKNTNTDFDKIKKEYFDWIRPCITVNDIKEVTNAVLKNKRYKHIIKKYNKEHKTLDEIIKDFTLNKNKSFKETEIEK